MSLLELPSDAEEAVGHLLDRYREDRDRWPLWTYERRDPAFHDIKASWIGQPWVERLMWSGVLPLRDTWRALRIAVRKAGGELIAFDPSKSSVAWLKGGVGPDPEHKPVTARVPVLLRMRHVALFASTADPRPPNKMTDVRLPGRWSVTRLPLDEKDRRDLGSCAVYALSRVKETQGPGGPHLSLLLRCLRYESTAGRGGSSAGERAKRRRTLERELAQGMGLLLDRSGGRKASLGGEMVSRLCTEAQEIGRKVRSWKPPDDLLELLDRLSEAELLVDEDAMDHLEWARYRRSDGGTPNRARAIALRFPFLTQEEISRALAKPVSKAQAMRWVRARLSSDISSSTLKNRRAKSFD